MGRSLIGGGFHVLMMVIMCLAVKGESKYLKWDVEYMFWSPDGQEHLVMGINGQFPGPTINVTVGELLHIDVTNKLHTEGLVIHWHGIRQQGTPWADGTASISQCAIAPGETFPYRFTVDKAGTYFYHGHYGMQRSAGLYGSLIVNAGNKVGEKKDPFHYDGEFNLLLSDWWHRSVHDQEVGLSSNPMRWINEPQTLLINGKGQYGCTIAWKYNRSPGALPRCNLTRSEQSQPNVFKVLPNKTYRLRIASTTALASLNLAIEGHRMVVVEADGNYVQPFSTKDIDIYSGESYSVLVKTNADPTNNYWISVGVRGRHPQTPPALALLNYLPNSASKFPISPPPATPRWDDYDHSKSFTNKILALMGTPKPPTTYNRRITLLNTQNRYDGGFIKWSINNVSLTLPPTPYIASIKYDLKSAFDQTPPPENFDVNYDTATPHPNPNTTVGNGVYRIEFGTTVDVILQNANALAANVSEIHPWHLHGHDFWVLGYGEGKFTGGEEDQARLNLKNPPLRNTVVIFPYGWTALRFVADNPGVWAFHCHIEPHLHMGMGVVLAEAMDRIGDVPKEAIGCGLTATMFASNGKNGGN